MRIRNIYEAKTNFSRLVELVQQGEEVVIAKAGKPVAKLVAFENVTKQRKPGRLRGKIKIAPDFDQTSDDIIRDFEGE